MSRTTVSLGAVVVMLVMPGNRAPARTIEGTLLSFAPGQALTVVNDQTDQTGLEFSLQGRHIEAREQLVPSTRVKVRFRVVGDRRPIVERVRVIRE